MEKLFNEHLAHSAREYVYYHSEEAKFVPDGLPGPNLINMSAGGFMERSSMAGAQQGNHPGATSISGLKPRSGSALSP